VAWLSGGGTSAYVIRTIHIPMAGHILSLNHKPSRQLDLDRDLQKGLDYIQAKGHGPDWTRNCRNSMCKFRRFLLHERGQTESHVTPYDPAPHTETLPTWLVEQLTRYQHIKQRNWRETYIEDAIRRFWSGHLRVWRFLVKRFGIRELSDLKRAHFMDFIDWRLQSGASVKGVNGDLRTFHGFMDFLQEQGWPVPHALLRLKCLKEPEPLPKFLTDEQVRALRDDFEHRVEAADNAAHRRDALLDRAMFYLLWQAGMRKGEVEDLRQEDLDLTGRRLTVRKGKGMLDRTVFLTDTIVTTLKAYLAVRGPGPTDHVFLYRNQPILKDLIHYRIKASGARTGVAVYAHRLRHTCATQLLNAGCRITTIQKFLGHKRITTTLTYARAHDQTVEDDYFRAMSSVEKRLKLMGQPEEEEQPVSEPERETLLTLVTQLTAPDISLEMRLELAERMRAVLVGCGKNEANTPISERRQPDDHPPPSLSILGH
jgi:integrase/recombinase XerD